MFYSSLNALVAAESPWAGVSGCSLLRSHLFLFFCAVAGGTQSFVNTTHGSVLFHAVTRLII